MKKWMSLLLAAAMLLGLLAGCGSSSTTTTTADETSEETAAAAETTTEAAAEDTAEAPAAATEEAADEAAADEQPEASEPTAEAVDLTITMPLTEDDVSFTMWHDFVPLLANYMEGMQDNLAYATMEELSGVHMEFTNVSKESAATAVSLLVASGDYPEIWDGFAGYYGQGIDTAIDDDIIYDLAEFKDLMPNYFNLVDNNDDYKKETYTDTGSMGLAYCLNSEWVVEYGLVVRQDWMDALGLDTPVTYDDFTDVLTALHDEYGAYFWTTYLGDDSYKSISAAFGVTAYNNGSETYFEQVDGEVRFSPLESGYLDYLTLMNQWYEAGILYPDFISGTGTTTCDPSLMGNGTIAMTATPAGLIDQFYALSEDASFDLAPLARPVQNAGDEVHMGSAVQWTATNGFSISTAIDSDSPEFEILLKWVDYWYTDEGSLLANYGVEDETYTLDADGNPQYTDMMLNNPDGLAFTLCMNRYTLFVGSFVVDNARTTVTYTDKQAECVEMWSANSGDGTYAYPVSVSLTADESATVASLYNDIATYVESETLAFITGSRPLSEYDAFCDTIRGMGIDQLIEVYQDCLDRYNAR
jgi:putative aldouronate transport system substrate-binding protein